MKVNTFTKEAVNEGVNQSNELTPLDNALNNKVLDVWLTVKEAVNLLGISKVAFHKNRKVGKYAIRTITGNGGEQFEVLLSSLSEDAQKKYWQERYKTDSESVIACSIQNPIIANVVNQIQLDEELSKPVAITESDKTYLPKALQDSTALLRREAVEKALNVPVGYKVKEWQLLVANEYRINHSTLYRWMVKYQKGGHTNLLHGNARQTVVRAWDDAALKYMVGLFLKREHRKVSFSTIYKYMCVEANRQGWKYGSYASAASYIKKFQETNAPLIALRDKGERGLDNAILPIFRSYHDLKPFQIVVGDQHRFDFWVVDEDTGKIFRPEGYCWQDLCTRNVYGFALGKKYDAVMMGDALRVGIEIYGKPEQCFTDNGGPETSKYFHDAKFDQSLSILYRGDIGDYADDSTVNEFYGEVGGVYGDLSITRRLAKVRNAKSKMIEGTFRFLEQMMIDAGTPGSVHRLGADKEQNDIDDKDIQDLYAAGKLLTFTEFCIKFIRVCDVYNSQKHHKGLSAQARREKLGSAFNLNKITPREYLAHRYQQGWRPVRVGNDALDIIFMRRAIRKISKSTILFNHTLYTADELSGLADGTPVEIRWRPEDTETLLVLKDGRYVCDARQIELGSMINDELTVAKNRAKAELKRKYKLTYKEFVKPVADLRAYSEAEINMTLIADERKKVTNQKAVEQAHRERLLTNSELEQEQRKIIQKQEETKAKIAEMKELPARPAIFKSELKRYHWCHEFIMAGGTLSDNDAEFVCRYQSDVLKDGAQVYVIERMISNVEAYNNIGG